jgi:hypothetical protein
MKAAGDKRDITDILERDCCLRQGEAAQVLAKSVSRLPDNPLGAVAEAVNRVLEGERVEGTS